MFTALILGLLALGFFTAITLISYAIAVVVSAICKKLIERNKKREIMLPYNVATGFIQAVGEKDPGMGKKLAAAFEDEDGKLGFELDYDNNVTNVETITADNSDVDDIRDVTQIYANGKHKVYT